MKKKLLFIIMGVFVLVMGTACSNDKEITNDENKQTMEENQPNETESKKVEEDKIGDRSEISPGDDDKNGNESEMTEGEAPPKNEQTSIDKLKELDLIGSDSEQVKARLGEPQVDHKDSVMHAWRYDYASSNYNFDNELISVDVTGLTNGEMETQLVIYFEENVVTSYSIYYLKEKDIMQYMVTKDGAEEFSASAD